MRILLLLFVSCCLTNLYAQSIDDLDRKNGFNQFQLGDSKSKWDSYMELTEFKFNDPNTKMYFYTGNCCPKLFGYDLRGVFLTFQKDKLVEIAILFDKGKGNQQALVDCQDRLLEIMRNLIILYGEPQSAQNPKASTPTPCLMWTGKKVSLVVTHAQYFNANLDCSTNITVSDMQYLNGKYDLQNPLKPDF